MQRIKNNVKTYHARDGWFFDVVEDDEKFSFWLYRGEWGHKTMYFASPKEQPTAENTTLKSFLRGIENTWEDYTDLYEREEEALDDLDDQLESEYCMEHTEIGEDGYAVIEGTEKCVELAKEIRGKYFEYVRETFKTKYKDSVEAFLRWVALTHTESAWWIACEQNDGLCDMFYVLSMFEAWRRS